MWGGVHERGERRGVGVRGRECEGMRGGSEREGVRGDERGGSERDRGSVRGGVGRSAC